MSMHGSTRRSVLAAGVGLPLGAGTARAQSFPARPVTLVVPYAAGGPTDLASRVIAEQMRGPLRGQVIVENRPGDSTIIGARHVASAQPDGYTLLMVPTTTLCTNPHIYARLPYRVEDFAPVGMAVKVPLGLAVRSSLPVHSIAEFREYVQARPSRMNYGSPGTGSNSQLVNALANMALGIQMNEVPYRGTAPALNDLVAGHVDALVDAIATLAPLHRAQRIRVLGNFDDVRSNVLPDVPTFRESGYQGLVAFTWFAVVAPAATPPDVIQVLNAALTTAVEAPATRERFAELGFVPQTSTPAALAAYIRSEFDRWGPLIRQLGIRVE
jgi:tripartite-type tricarboxylate transporter receptor subunit TctC